MGPKGPPRRSGPQFACWDPRWATLQFGWPYVCRCFQKALLQPIIPAHVVGSDAPVHRASIMCNVPLMLMAPETSILQLTCSGLPARSAYRPTRKNHLPHAAMRAFPTAKLGLVIWDDHQTLPERPCQAQPTVPASLSARMDTPVAADHAQVNGTIGFLW